MSKKKIRKRHRGAPLEPGSLERRMQQTIAAASFHEASQAMIRQQELAVAISTIETKAALRPGAPTGKLFMRDWVTAQPGKPSQEFFGWNKETDELYPIDMQQFGQIMRSVKDRVLSRDVFSSFDMYVSTVFLSMVHGYLEQEGQPPMPLLFETMIFKGGLEKGKDNSIWCYRTPTAVAAKDCHERACIAVMSGQVKEGTRAEIMPEQPEIKRSIPTFDAFKGPPSSARELAFRTGK